MFNSLSEWFQLAGEQGLDPSEIIINQQIDQLGMTKQEIMASSAEILAVMRTAIAEGMRDDIQTTTGLIGPDAHRLWQSVQHGDLLSGSFTGKVLTYAYATSTFNAAMGKIVAAPTAGSSGILPAILLAAAEDLAIADTQLVRALLMASGIGLVISKKATLAGAAGGCQAECGAAAAMAAGALAYLRGATFQQIDTAVAIALKNMLGLVCDPVAGLVEIPCIKRNATSAAHAVVAADLACAGIESLIPADEVITAMAEIGQMLPVALKETAQGGLATTPTGCRIKEKLNISNV